MILIDANVFMYAAGEAHAHKQPSLALLARVADGSVDGVTDAEVLQEILHRYRRIGRWQRGAELYEKARKVVPTVIPVTAEAMDIAKRLLDRYPGLQTRDAVHAAVCEDAEVDVLCTYDGDFSIIRGLKVLRPEQIR